MNNDYIDPWKTTGTGPDEAPKYITIISLMKQLENKMSIRKVIYPSQKRTTGECKIYIEIVRFLLDGKKTTRKISTDVWVLPSNWNAKKQQIKQNDPDSDKKNIDVELLFNQASNKLYNREIASADPINPKLETIAELFPVKEPKTLVEFIDQYIEYRKGLNTPNGTLKEFTTCKNRIKNYQTTINRNLNFEDMNLTFSDGLFQYFLKEGYATGTIQKTYSILITILNYYYERKDELNIKLTDKFRSKSFKRGEKSINDPNPLIRDEFKLLQSHRFENTALETTRKRFILQCSTGMRFSDVFRITPSMINDSCINYSPVKTIHKTDNRVSVPLNNLSEGILKEYEYNSTKLKISNQKYNESLKEMWKELNKKYDIIHFDQYTSHNGRDTFITYSIEGGVDVPSLLKMVGQESWSIMKRYFKVTNEQTVAKMKLVTEFNPV